MAKKKKPKQIVELRFYEIPRGEPVLALYGEEWDKIYGKDTFYLHFHNLLEIGICRRGDGELVIGGRKYRYRTNQVTMIPPEVPHTTISNGQKPSSWEFMYVDVAELAKEMFGDNAALRKRLQDHLDSLPNLMDMKHHPRIVRLIFAIIEEEKQQKLYYRQIAADYLRALVYEVMRLDEEYEERDPERRKIGRGAGTVERVLAYVAEHYTEELKVSDLAAQCSMCETYFRQVFEEHVHMAPMEYVNLMRIQKACELLKTGNDPMDDVAAKVGYTTTSTFNRNFKKFMNTSPYQWKIDPEHYERRLQELHINALKGW